MTSRKQQIWQILTMADRLMMISCPHSWLDFANWAYNSSLDHGTYPTESSDRLSEQQCLQQFSERQICELKILFLVALGEWIG